MNANVCRWIMDAIIMLGLIVAGISGAYFGLEPVSPLFILGIVVSLGGLIFGLLTIRCPFCKHLLDLRGFQMVYCPYCGQKLE